MHVVSGADSDDAGLVGGAKRKLAQTLKSECQKRYAGTGMADCCLLASGLMRGVGVCTAGSNRKDRVKHIVSSSDAGSASSDVMLHNGYGARYGALLGKIM